METKNKNNSGAIFKNKNKTKDTQPDFKGTINIEGKEMEISLWIKESKKDGSKFYSAALQQPYKKDSQVITKPDTFGIAGDNNFRIDSKDDFLF